jgi:hypothetical protein
MIEFNAQKAIFEALTASAALMSMVVDVYDCTPQADDSGSDAAFPYITIGDDSISEWDTDTELGAEITLTIHTWSRYHGRSEMKEIQAEIYSILHRACLSVECYNLVGIEFLSSDSFMDPDGKTWHGTQTFRLTVEE